jgi:hypothetical protein
MPWYPFFEKMQQADVFILLGHCQFEKNGFQNRFSINNKEEYVDSYSKWLYNKFGYSIGRAAFRARNAVYFAAIPGDHKTESKSFPVKETEDGFYFIGEERKTLDSFF